MGCPALEVKSASAGHSGPPGHAKPEPKIFGDLRSSSSLTRPRPASGSGLVRQRAAARVCVKNLRTMTRDATALCCALAKPPLAVRTIVGCAQLAGSQVRTARRFAGSQVRRFAQLGGSQVRAPRLRAG